MLDQSLLRRGDYFEFAIDPSERNLRDKRRERVIGKDHPVRTPDRPGVYVFLAGDRCLYVGKAAKSILVGRALDYLYQEGDRERVYSVISSHADRLFILKVQDDDVDAARRLELELIVNLQPMLNEGFIYASASEKERFGLK